jgi:hypothetical protein
MDAIFSQKTDETGSTGSYRIFLFYLAFISSGNQGEGMGR